jgi:gluconate kinase
VARALPVDVRKMFRYVGVKLEFRRRSRKENVARCEASGPVRYTCSALKGRKAYICRTVSAELTFVYFQTFHVWL